MAPIRKLAPTAKSNANNGGVAMIQATTKVTANDVTNEIPDMAMIMLTYA